MGHMHSVLLPSSIDLQLQPIHKKLKNYRKNLKCFHNKIKSAVQSLKSVPSSSSDFTVLSKFQLYAELLPNNKNKFVLKLAENLAHRLRLCDRLYNEYMLGQVLLSCLTTIEGDQISKTEKVYKEISNPKSCATQSDIDILSRKAITLN
ncbi:hypothetical protein GJ496_009545 [Pomphorhynchus laevis]|nr:hypothetical protein GJ496_009545 [Pomphorhynchus laevis]